MVVALASVVLVIASPLRNLSADTVPGRIGALTLNCAGTLQLDRVDWISRETERDLMYYFMQYDKQRQFTSVFGPTPALVGALAYLDLGEGDSISDKDVRSRERWVGALLVALAAALLVLACAARQSLVRASVAGSVAVLSFAGAATLGQGLWQATPALPFLVGALATTAWRERRPGLAVITPALLVVAVMIRPVIAPLCIGIGLTWALETRRDYRTWLVAGAIALAAAVPFIVWNALHLSSPLPVGQWGANRRIAGRVFVASDIPVAIAGLLISPGRGLVLYAPIAVLGVAFAWRERRLRWIVAGCVVQVIGMAAFVKWHGGQSFGPRLLNELTWVALFLAFGAGRQLATALVAPAVVVTVIVGQLGLWRYHPEQWERRRAPDTHPGVLWDVVDSPIPATLTPPGAFPTSDDNPPLLRWHCEGGRLRTDPAKF